MNELDFNKLVDDAEYIDPNFGENGEMILSVHFQACYYLWNTHTPETRQAILNCYHRYMELWGGHITWGFDPLADWKQKPFNQLPLLIHVMDRFKHPDEAIEWYVANGGCKGEEVDYVNSYVFFFLTSPEWDIQDGSRLNFRVPRSLYFSETSKQQILDFHHYCLEQLKPWYAVAGMQAATPFSDNNIKIDLVRQARDFYHLYFPTTWDMVRQAYGIRSFDWLTYISHGLAEKIGGHIKLEHALNEAQLNYKTIGKGVLIQATEHPEIVPHNTPIPEGYSKLNRIVRPLRDGNYGSMGDGTYLGDNLQSFDDRLTDLWMCRFDHERVWNDLISTMSFTKPKDNIQLTTNQVCEISGRYRYDDDFDFARNEPMPYDSNDTREGDHRAYIMLNKGDIAPYYLKLDQHGNFIEAMEIQWTLFEEFHYF